MKARTIPKDQPFPEDRYGAEPEPTPEEEKAMEREYVWAIQRQAARDDKKGIIGELVAGKTRELREYVGLPRTLDTKFDEHSDGVFTFKSDQSIAFIDKDTRITVRSMHPDALKAALELAHERIGDKPKLEGSAEFQTEMKKIDAKSFDQEVVGELRPAGAWEPKKHEGAPRTLDTKFDRHEDGSYTFKEGKQEVAFIDKGDKVTIRSKEEDAIKASLELAQEKFGDKIQATGSEAGRRKAWLVGSEMGLTITGFEPTEQDKQMLSDRLQAAQGNYLTKGEVKQKTEPVAQASNQPDAKPLQNPANELQDKVTARTEATEKSPDQVDTKTQEQGAKAIDSYFDKVDAGTLGKEEKQAKAIQEQEKEQTMEHDMGRSM